MIRFDHLTLHYGSATVLGPLSCHIPRGQMVGLTGQSGCGKSSLLRAVVGLTPFQGQIEVDGHPLTERTCHAVRALTAYLPQDLSFPTEFVADAVEQMLRLRRAPMPDQGVRCVLPHFQQLGLEPELLQRRFTQISGGQRQRVMLSTLALLGRRLWLLDEPTSALDAALRTLVVRFLAQQQAGGATIVVVTHDHELAAHCTTLIPLHP